MKCLHFCVLILAFGLCLEGKVSYQTLDPTSISQHLAYYELYKGTAEGKAALECAWRLLSGKEKTIPLAFPQNIDGFIALINPGEAQSSFEISDEALLSIEACGAHLPNRKLKGYQVESLDQILALESEEIDLARALLISQLGSDRAKIRRFEAALDLMALQVLARTGLEADSVAKVQALNHLIFFELGFRFPPRSSYSQQIDLFTFLPQVLESRRGVCLGVSTLYMCLAQRVGLEYEIITPPGHIFVRSGNLNVETTLRGVHIHSDEYLGIHLRALPKRKTKELIGMAFYNQASVYLGSGDFEKAKTTYEKALPYMPQDSMLYTLYASSLFLTNHEEKAKELLCRVVKNPQGYLLSQDTLAEDILLGHVDKESLKPFFLYVDETRASIEKKKEALEKSLQKCPQFRSGLFQLAICNLQLQKPKEAISLLEKYRTLDPSSISCEFFLAELYFSRYDSPNAWRAYVRAEHIAKSQNFIPKPLEDLKVALSCRSPRINCN